MKKIALLFALIASLVAAKALAVFSLFTVSLVQPQGGGVNLVLSNIFAPPYGSPAASRTLDKPAVSTADYYHVDGLYWLRPYDLNAMGSWGQGIATSKGYRYIWLLSPDHPRGAAGTGFPFYSGWTVDGGYTYAGYSNDPAILPDPATLKQIITVGPQNDGGIDYYLGNFVKLVYNPDDPTNPAYVYIQAFANNQFMTALFKGANFDAALTYVGLSHQTTVPGGFAAQNNVFRTGVNTWFSYGIGGTNQTSANGAVKWTSTNGTSFTSNNTPLTQSLAPGRGVEIPAGSGDYFSVGGNTYAIAEENQQTNDGHCPGGFAYGYVTQFPVDAGGNLITGGSPPLTRISNQYYGCYPGPSHLQSVATYVENGVAYSYALHGFFPSGTQFSLANGDYANGGGLQEDYIDLYITVVDATAAADASPPGAAVTVLGGVVTLLWYDVLPNHTYRVKDCGTDSSCASPSTLGNPTTGQFQVSPAVSTSCALHYYQVVTLNSGVEKGSRTVHTFVGSGGVLANKHITRVCDAGADYATIDQSWIATVDTWLENTCRCLQNLMWWTNPSFGIVRGAGSAINTVMDLGTTRLPRGGDYTPVTPANTTYSATGCNSAVPGWVNANNTSFGYFGGLRVNNIRRKNQITLVSGYSSSSGADLFGNNQFKGLYLIDSSGSPHTVTFAISDANGNFVSDTQNVNAGHTTQIIGGTFNGTTVKSWVEGVGGTGASGPSDNYVLIGVMGNGGELKPFLASGSRTATFDGGVRTFGSNGALYSGCDLVVFDVDLSALTCGGSNCLTSLSAMLRTRYGN